MWSTRGRGRGAHRLLATDLVKTKEQTARFHREGLEDTSCYFFFSQLDRVFLSN